jgi:hypothetical protein
LTDAARGDILWVEKVRTNSHACLIDRKIIAASLVSWWVENSKLRILAVDRLIPGCEDKQRTHKVVERINVVHPTRTPS